VDALVHFGRPGNVKLAELNAASLTDWRSTATELLRWYRSWRNHGQMSRRWDKRAQVWTVIPAAQQAQNRAQQGFPYARRDHNEGLDVQGTGARTSDPEHPKGKQGETFRPALGLPIIQFYSSLGDDRRGPLSRSRATVNWEFSDGEQKGRFASPVLLRPHRDAQGRWHALVIFVDAHRWPDGKKVYLNGQERAVSLELYEAMKHDPALQPFP
jgi:hypothetical protein